LDLETRSPHQKLFRIGRRPDPWAPPDWSNAHDDGTFGNRFDDPKRRYRVIYASSQRLGCYLETLARFRPDLSLLAEFSEIEGDNDFTPLGSVPLSWFEKRSMGSAQATGFYADIFSSGWLAHLRKTLAVVAIQLGIRDIDTSVLQSTLPRRFTQMASFEVWSANLDGIFYRSRFGHDLENWAIFEPFNISDVNCDDLRIDDACLIEAMKIHQLQIGA